MVLLHLSISIFYVLFLIVMSSLLARTSLFVCTPNSIVMLYLHVHILPKVCVSTSFLLFQCLGMHIIIIIIIITIIATAAAY